MMTDLDKALVELRADLENDTVRSAYYDLFLNTTFCVPTLSPEQAKEVAPEAAAAGESLPLVVEAEGKDYLLLFDTFDRMHAWTKEVVPFVEVPGHTLATITRPPLHWALNVGTDYSKQFHPEEIVWLQEVVAQCEAIAGEKPSE